MVSATPIVPSDPRFEEQKFRLIEIKPDYNYTKTAGIIHTNNVLEAFEGYFTKNPTNTERTEKHLFLHQ